MEAYNPVKIEKKWQETWEKEGSFKAEDFSKKPKKYILIEFPYPSGDGLHVGHARSYSALDAIVRKKRMEGYNILFPIGWDAFGLPTENYAIKTGIHPQKATEENIAVFKRQLKSLGLSFDWSREINTTDPKYYKWTQWIFLKLFKEGLAYQTEIPINWCPSCKIGLANEEVVGGACERCETPVGKKTLKQWMLKITAYADRLIEDLEKVDYLEKIKAQQKEWIGKSYGTEADFKVVWSNEIIKVFTTRIDTIFGVTALVLAPEHPLVEKLTTEENKENLERYIKESRKKSDFEREKLEKEKTGVFTGSYCFNPCNNEKVPIWVADFVIATYGGGAVMVVPAHDYRDYDFAKKYGLEIREVVSGGDTLKGAFVEYGNLVNSGQFNGLSSEKAIEKIAAWLEKRKLGKKKIQYKLRDWVFSRQHYWGEPIPIIHCSECGAVPVPEKDLPVELPYVEKYQPTGTGESPLANITNWVDVKCPKCGGKGKRETDTMPNWAGSNWYYMRYVDPENDNTLADSKKLKYWLPVDWYNGGMEHTTLHLLYSRFIYKFLYDIKVAPSAEPYQRRTSHGIVLAEDGRKMSKSFGNVINPDNIVRDFGADTLRVYEMFMGPFDQAIAWNTQGVKGVFRFLGRAWNFVLDCSKNKKSNKEIQKALHKLNKKIDENLEATKFNTTIAAFMEFVNLGLESRSEVGRDIVEKFLILLSPFAPHISEELWLQLGNSKSIFEEEWSKPDPKLLKEEVITMIVQINGKVRDKIEVEADISEEKAKELAFSQEKVKKWTEGKEIKKVIFVPGRLINIVI
ncbi:MAG: leucine--tRNA ligase [Candidatus Nealsonbacteria bacterium RBG_13_36_15]|uniref:Leucine--tRNA ligase n=1 Tax=Candidatus Nealsonbacteria bacterium RBG_13_36_15 TaxID=1801660 RepID=A0A1G2DWA0_9BACT|nr:MAG: leucine--tRNA ligase [Candidatus Nealsonbacteria bacterium RBG_13_36_15]